MKRKMTAMAANERRGLISKAILYLIVAAVFAVGGYATWLRFSEGLGAVTDLSDSVPWGLWVWHYLTEIPLSAGGFTLCALFFIFGVRSVQPLIRPAILISFIGYSMVVLELIYDLGHPLRAWYWILHWNHHSVMFEIIWCITLYVGVLAVEMSIPVTEGLKWSRLTGFLKKFCALLAIAGAVFSILHQSSLGALFVIVPEKLHPLWYSTWIHVLFLASAFAAGLGFITMIAFLCERFLDRKFPPSLFKSLSRLLLGAVIFYLAIAIAEFTWSGKWPLLGSDMAATAWLGLEILLSAALPLVLLSIPAVRRSRKGLLLCAIITVCGVSLNRLNVTVIGFLLVNKATYFPTWQEFAIMIMLITLGVKAFVAASRRFPIFED